MALAQTARLKGSKSGNIIDELYAAMHKAEVRFLNAWNSSRGTDPLTSLLTRLLVADLCCHWYCLWYCQNKVGGGEGLEGIYGSITQQGMTEVLTAFQQHSQLDAESVLVDIGSGLGR